MEGGIFQVKKPHTSGRSHGWTEQGTFEKPKGRWGG